ncbi:WD40 repeat protein [Dokdonia sp. Hel_I_63]|uniref:OmpA family protein n=1 Tax=Dokdonia sp. Hel_I_63 TaxID=1249996 RepID=UPI00119AB22E|nr:OmpA family protein [Dokdonia sp. Hel_I_63]TVZ23442.1 WD40 repeat protein [Dokdonia sp. Hel_I_63]
MKKSLYILFMLCVCSSYAQNDLKKADELYDRHMYADAAVLYDQHLNDSEKVSPATWQHIADTHYNLKNYERAEIAYTKTFDALGYTMEPAHIWQYFDVLRFLKKYDQADDFYVAYLKLSKKNKELNRYYEEKSRFNDILANDTLYQIRNLEINSSYADFGGSLYKNKLVFSTARNDEENKLYKRDNTPYLSLYEATIDSTGAYSNIKLFSEDLETQYHDATATFYNNDHTLVYASSAQSGSRKIYTKNKRNFFKLYRVQINDDKFDKEELPINGNGYSIGQPFVTIDGSQLYFVSDMPGGYGRADIYVCDIREDGSLSTPRNLGDAVNTPYDDFFPFVKNKELYFASKGHVGFGGLDIYKAQLRDGIYSNARNLGLGINSNADDFAYVASNVKNEGYFSSNREGGKGDDDIYSFVYDRGECFQTLEGTVTDSQTGAPLPAVTIIAYDTSNKQVAETFTDTAGTYTLQMGCNIKYNIKASKIGYSKDELDLNTGTEPNGLINFVDFKLANLSDIFVTDGEIEKIKINPINFESNRYAINIFAAQQLQRIIDIMNEYPALIIKIESHTDQRGGASYNQTLSENRAISTRDYLIKNGITSSRIESAKGFGESRPIHICDEADDSCTEVQYLENRRSDFIVVRR